MAPAAKIRIAESLARYLNDGTMLLHDRRIPRSRAKRYKGKVAVSKPLFGQAKLTIAGRDKSKLADGLAKQVALVEAAVLEVAPDVPVHGALCFVDADLPMLGKLSFKGFPLLYPKSLAKRINAAGPLDRERVHAVATELAIRFPVA